MRKIAIFVEGMTEQEFVIALVTSVVGAKGLQFERAQQLRNSVVISHVAPEEDTKFFILVVDCRGDSQVKSQIREQYQKLTAAGFTSIIGLRDVYPLAREDIEKIQQTLDKGLPSGEVKASLYLAVMEVEAWFIAESTHFEKIDPLLTHDVRVAAGFDTTRHPDLWDHPAETLHAIYKLGNKAYVDSAGSKTRNRVQRTLRALSFDEMYVNVRSRITALDGFVNEVERALFDVPKLA